MRKQVNYHNAQCNFGLCTSRFICFYSSLPAADSPRALRVATQTDKTKSTIYEVQIKLMSDEPQLLMVVERKVRAWATCVYGLSTGVNELVWMHWCGCVIVNV